MPIGMVLGVDEGLVQDVSRERSNSTLRFQSTQGAYDRCRGAITLGNPELTTGGPDAGPVPGSVRSGGDARGPRGGVRGVGRDEDLPGAVGPPRRGPGGRGGVPIGFPPELPGGIGPGVDEEAS